MAKGQDLSGHQRKIVSRYYDHRDTIMATKLSELVSELYLAEGKKAETLWGRAAKALANTDADPARAARIVETRDTEALARLVTSLSSRTPKKR